ncbi:MAG: hypothetical protein HQK59_15235 [Deltaproteobacteria bacterium]|nr:hypothetical protein [Deltaproteobacteria bacterium]
MDDEILPSNLLIISFKRTEEVDESTKWSAQTYPGEHGVFLPAGSGHGAANGFRPNTGTEMRCGTNLGSMYGTKLLANK